MTARPTPAQAFIYLEHSYVADMACWQAQNLLGVYLQGHSPEARDPRLVARYLAMALACPTHHPRDYCQQGRKMVQSSMHALRAPVAQGRDYPVTLGDFAAMPDHISQFGPIRHLPRAERPGLVQDALTWLAQPPGKARGIVSRVGKRVCSDAHDVPWADVARDVDQWQRAILEARVSPGIPSRFLTPLAREAVPIGPEDPSGLYSFTNPHYLDLVLRNHHHFSPHNYGTWLGFHSAALEIARRPCEASLALKAGILEDAAENLEGFANIDWGALAPDEGRRLGCAALGEQARQRLLAWRNAADPTLVQPVGAELEALAALESPRDPAAMARTRTLLDMVVSAFQGIVMEGSGLHFLQDGLAGGHLRTIRTRGGLGEARYDHDHDNQKGVTGLYRTRQGLHTLVFFGDSYILAPALEPSAPCDWKIMDQRSPGTRHVTGCLVRHQRGLLVASSAASLVDWALDGTLYEQPPLPAADEASRVCPPARELAGFVCHLLPMAPTVAAGETAAVPLDGAHPMESAAYPRHLTLFPRLHHGTLPVPPPPFNYESLTITLGFDVAGSTPQAGLQLTFHSELDAFANWLTSFRMGILTTLGTGERSQYLGEFGYNFHWRWSARFLIEGGAFGFLGFRDFSQGLSFFSGMGPTAALVALPEGWVKIPLEISLGFRFPMTFFSSDHGFFGESFNIEAYWLQVGLGLAFM